MASRINVGTKECGNSLILSGWLTEKNVVTKESGNSLILYGSWMANRINVVTI